MKNEELIEQSKSIVKDVYDNISKIEAVGKLLDAVKEGSISILMPDGALVDLNVLTDIQFAEIKNCISGCLECSMNRSSKYLERVIKSQKVPAVVNEEFEAAIVEMKAKSEAVGEKIEDTPPKMKDKVSKQVPTIRPIFV